MKIPKKSWPIWKLRLNQMFLRSNSNAASSQSWSPLEAISVDQSCECAIIVHRIRIISILKKRKKQIKCIPRVCPRAFLALQFDSSPTGGSKEVPAAEVDEERGSDSKREVEPEVFLLSQVRRQKFLSTLKIAGNVTLSLSHMKSISLIIFFLYFFSKLTGTERLVGTWHQCVC